jgi:hypothetical protein
MGCDIHTYIEVQDGTGQWRHAPGDELFGRRSYGVFGFLADVRNYSAVTPIAEPRGLPEDVSFGVTHEHAEWEGDAHTESWLSARELVDFDYEQEMNDRRITRQTGPNSWNGGITGEPEEGTVMPYREFLGQAFLDDVAKLASLGDPDHVRLVFWFDN